ncbi:nuclear export mediator factor [Trichophyton mentagrophytes]|nr:nuclear export mediator factor [Trichophyton mentagrophytes]
MKQRYSSLDVKVISRELSANILGLRIANIYDISGRTFLFKLALPDIKKQLIINAGFHCHLTESSRTTADAPSHFVSRLRKLVKTRRITGVHQIGTDRIIEFEISDGLFRLYLEFFAAGNLILTDAKYEIVALLRHVAAGSDIEEVKIGMTYRLESKLNYNGIPPLTIERLKSALDQDNGSKVLKRSLYFGFPEYPPTLLDHAFNVVGFDSKLQPAQILTDNNLVQKLMEVLQEADRVNTALSSDSQQAGYIIAKNVAPTASDVGGDIQKAPVTEFRDFHPFEPSQSKEAPDTTILRFENFNSAVDRYFSSIEARKLESRLTEKEDAARKKLESTKREHEKRVNALKEKQEFHVRKARAIETNLPRVEEAMNAVNGLVAQGMDWVEIARLIEMEQGKGNPVAQSIKLPLKLYENTITVLLNEEGTEVDEEEEEEESEEEQEEEEDDDGYGDDEYERPSQKKQLTKPLKEKKEMKDTRLSIDIDLGISPWANARQYYDEKKIAAVKEEKTLKASTKAIKSTERKVKADLKMALKQEKPVLRRTRNPTWFEKFFFFISSDGYLVIGGRDHQQDEILFQRYMKKGDIYVHTDLDGGVPLIVKNKPDTPDDPIPPNTISQASAYTVASSKAWDTKAAMGGWWVHASQVSKMTSTGDILKAGHFMIKGEKNHIPPGQIVLGFAVSFQISNRSVQNHKKCLPSAPEDDVANDEPISSTGDMDQPEANQSDPEEDVPLEQEDEHQEEPEDSKKDIIDERVAPLGEQLKSMHVEDSLDSNPAQVHEADKEEALKAENQPVEGPSKNAEGPEDSEESDDESILATPSATQESRASTPSAISSSGTQKSKPPVRGKRGKAKKLATKYKDQDEEDRKLALRLLGSAAGPSAPTNKPKTKADIEAEREAQKERRRAQHERALQAVKRQQEAFTRNSVEDASGEEHKLDFSILPALVGTPVEGDEIEAAIPVCAPWAALGQYKYRAKLQPGKIKKGKAVKDILGKWIHDATVLQSRSSGKKPAARTGDSDETKETNEETDAKAEDANELLSMELDCIKAWRDVEVMNTLPVGGFTIVSVAGAAGSSASVGPKNTENKGKGKGKKPGKGGKKK